MKWKIHPAADVWPVLSSDKLAEMAEDIKQNGQQTTVKLWKDEDGETWLLDGRNRVIACEHAGVEPRAYYVKTDDPIKYVQSANKHRRHSTPAELASVARKLIPLYEEQARRRMATKGGPVGPPQKEKVRASDQAAAAVGASGRSTRRAQKVAREAPDLMEKVEDGDMSLREAEKEVDRRNAPKVGITLKGKRVNPSQSAERACSQLRAITLTIDETVIAHLSEEELRDLQKALNPVCGLRTIVNRILKEK